MYIPLFDEDKNQIKHLNKSVKKYRSEYTNSTPKENSGKLPLDTQRILRLSATDGVLGKYARGFTYQAWGDQDSPRYTAEAGTTASCARAPRTSSCLGRNGSPRTQFEHRPGNDGSGFGVGALRPPVPGCSTTLGASATPKAVSRWW